MGTFLFAHNSVAGFADLPEVILAARLYLLRVANRYHMFRYTLILLVTIRVILCPLFCAAGNGVLPCDRSQVAGCSCSRNTADLCDTADSSRRPGDSPVPRRSPCICQSTPELIGQKVRTDFTWTLEFRGAYASEFDFFNSHSFRFDAFAHHKSLCTGRSTRLALGSLLL